jgi:hypothetical protein
VLEHDPEKWEPVFGKNHAQPRFFTTFARESVMSFCVRLMGLTLALVLAVLTVSAHAQSWPTRAVKFIVPFGPGAGVRHRRQAARGKAAGQMGSAGRHREQAGRRRHHRSPAYLGANDDHVLMFGPSGGFVVHPFLYSKLPYNPADIIPIARLSTTILAGRGEKGCAVQQPQGIHRGRPRGTRYFQLRPGAGHHRVDLLGLSAS